MTGERVRPDRILLNIGYPHPCWMPDSGAYSEYRTVDCLITARMPLLFKPRTIGCASVTPHSIIIHTAITADLGDYTDVELFASLLYGPIHDMLDRLHVGFDGPLSPTAIRRTGNGEGTGAFTLVADYRPLGGDA